jgi:DNA-binding response OmpR family regulator
MSGAEVIQSGDLEIRPAESSAFANGKLLPLTARELAVLAALARRAGRIVSREELTSEVWGRSYRPGDRSVDVYVAKLRLKLERAAPRARYIHTHFGFGYRFSPEPHETSRGHVGRR